VICSFYHPIPSGRSSKGYKFFLVLVENFYYTGSRLCRLAHNETSVSRKILVFQQRLAIKETIAWEASLRCYCMLSRTQIKERLFFRWWSAINQSIFLCRLANSLEHFFSQYRHQSKMSSSKKLICKGTLRQVFIRVYRQEIHSVMLVFLTQLCQLLHPFYLLWFIFCRV